MTRVAAVLLLAVVGAAPAPLVRVQVEGTPPYFVGQQIRVDVQVLVPNFFLSPPQFPVFDVPGAAVTLLDERAVNSTETVGGVQFAGIMRTYAITPQQAGELKLPPAAIAFGYAAEPGQPEVSASVTLPPETITATLPAGASPDAAAAPVAEMTVTQTLDGDPATIVTGGTLTRTVEAFAPQTQAMMIPPPVFPAPAGVRVYPRDPVLTDGADGGRRVDRVTYRFDAPGTFALPPVELDWVDPATGERRTSSTPAVSVTVARGGAGPAIAPAAPTAGEERVGQPRAPVDWRVWAAAGAAVALALLGVRAWRRWAAPIRAWREARRRAQFDSLAAHRARAERACAGTDPLEAYRMLAAWAHRTGAVSPTVAAAADPALRDAVATLERRLFGPGTATDAWDGRALAAALRRAGEVERIAPRPSALPALNPSSR